MRIEFSYCGNGTNIEVFLIDQLDAGWPPAAGPGSAAEAVVDRIYSADHAGGIHYPEERGIPINARQLFQWVEDSWAPPIIGGRYSAHHPYWRECEEKRKARENG
jgi:hypothetical protein